MVAMLKKARGAVADPGRLKAFLGAVRGSVKTDLSLEAMYALAIDLPETRLSFETVPGKPYAQQDGVEAA
ncbi:hypothetical protein ITP53_34515 [Nonomuraea sp. K274]|uniref:Uncharacterized protein n=1 Tax=Nonomuraea cypriaca TaxID=1187855 RepID=A0A931AD24_9ACTN|nr:hypothetical protein [Nonomuraea cypriaca]MBF8190737.1 hypothetical protein [Nonomuraea cypriaca]